MSINNDRVKRLQQVTQPLPGSVPYDNLRPLNVPLEHDRRELLQFLTARFSHFGVEYWKSECTKGRILLDGTPLGVDAIVRAGNQLSHLEPGIVEPDINAEIEILHEDDDLVVVNKPAPLPIHPSGRFHRNTLQWIMEQVFAPNRLYLAHRLDANTTGVVIFAKSSSAARHVQSQFEQGSVSKTYLARVQGTPTESAFTCDAPISRETNACGGRNVHQGNGLPALTDFSIIGCCSDRTTLLEVVPKTGRTNQIRVHLWHLGLPIVGDPLYLPERKFGDSQTMKIGQQMCLHAWKLALRHPADDKIVSFFAAVPEWGRIS